MAVALTMSLAMNAQSFHRQGGPGRDMDPKKMVEMKVDRMEKELNLSAKQKEAIFEIYMKEAEMMEQNFKERPQKRDEARGQRGDMKADFEKMKAHQDAVNARVAEVLNDDQKAKFAELEKEHPGHPGGMHHMMPKGDHKKGEGSCKGDCCGEMKGKTEGKCDHEKMGEAKGECEKKGMSEGKCEKKDMSEGKCEKKGMSEGKCEKKGMSEGKCEHEKMGAKDKQCAHDKKKTE